MKTNEAQKAQIKHANNDLLQTTGLIKDEEEKGGTMTTSSKAHSFITSKDIEAIKEKASRLLPHSYKYNKNNEKIGMIFHDREDIPNGTYEEVIDRLDIYQELDRYDDILQEGKWLERLEHGIDYLIDNDSLPEPDWIVDGIAIRGGLTLVYGGSGVGKTTFLLYLADAVKAGKPLFGLECKRGSVIFIEQDESLDLLKSHQDKIGLPNKPSVAKVHINWDADNKCFNKEMESLLHYYSPDLLIIDAYTSLEIPDITRPESALVFDKLRSLAQQYGTSIIVVHHANKSGGQMGSNLHTAKMDSVICLSKEAENEVLLTQEKIRGSKFEPISLEFNQDTLEMKEKASNLKERVRQLRGQSKSDQEIKVILSRENQGTLSKYLREIKP